MKSAPRVYYVVDIRDPNVGISNLKHDTSGGLDLPINEIFIKSRRCILKDIKKYDKVLKFAHDKHTYQLEALEAEIKTSWGDRVNVQITSTGAEHTLELEIDRGDRLPPKSKPYVVLDENEAPRMIVYSEGKTYYVKSQAARKDQLETPGADRRNRWITPDSERKKHWRTPETRDLKQGNLIPAQAPREQPQLKPSFKERFKNNEERKFNERMHDTSYRASSSDKRDSYPDGFTEVRARSKNRRDSSQGLVNKSIGQHATYINDDHNYKFIPHNRQDPRNTKFDIGLLSRMHRDTKSQIENLKDYYSSFRYFEYSNDSYYKCVGIGYLEFLLHKMTDPAHLHNFIELLISLDLQDEKKQHRDVVIRLLNVYKDKLTKGPLNFNKICSNSTFMTPYISLLRSLAGYQMKLEGESDFSIQTQTVRLDAPNIKTFKYLPKILKALVVLHNIELAKPFEHGHIYPIVSIHIVLKFNIQHNERNMELLYFKYLDPDYPGSIDLDKFRCHICGKLLHETAFPVNDHPCCCKCIALLVLQDKQICSGCKVPFRPSLIKFIQLRDYQCSKCLRFYKFDDLKEYDKHDKLVCNTCVRAAKEDLRKAQEENRRKRMSSLLEITQESEESEPDLEHIEPDGPQENVISQRTFKCSIKYCRGNDESISLECSHAFCRGCILGYFEEMNRSDELPIACPECRTPLSDENILSFIKPSVAEDYFSKISAIELVCEECKERANIRELVRLECGHRFDHNCLEEHFRKIINSGSGLINCPKNCPGEVKLDIIQLLLSPINIKKYQKQVEEFLKYPPKPTKCLLDCDSLLIEEEDPVHLHCYHSFCRSCAIVELTTQVRRKSSVLTCPICSQSLLESEYSSLLDPRLLANFLKNKK